MMRPCPLRHSRFILKLKPTERERVILGKEVLCMITLFVIGILVFTGKLIHFAFKAAWGIAKGILFVIGIPLLLIGLFVAGLVSLAMPLLILALLAAFLGPVLKGR